MEYKYVLGIKLHILNMKKAIKKSTDFIYDKNQHYITTVNPEIALYAFNNEKYQFIINNADINLTDGIGLQIASKIFQQTVPTRITGVDFSIALMKKAEKKHWPIFLLGTNNREILESAKRNIEMQFPLIQITGISTGPCFRNTHDLCLNSRLKAENNKLINEIKKSKAKILFVAFGAPKQEQWIKEYLSQIPNIQIAIGVGGTLDYISGRTKRAPKIIRKIGLEWLYRVIQEPSRITRIIKATCVFMFHIVYWRIRMSFSYRPNALGIFINKDKQVLLVQNATEPGNWKFPQGGIEKGESPTTAIYREMEEELGSNKFKIRYQQKNFHSYQWPMGYRGKYGRKGQRQHLFILDYLGGNNDFDFSITEELIKHKWVSINRLIDSISDIRKPIAQKILKILEKLY